MDSQPIEVLITLPLPEGTRIGHVPLHVASLDETMDFYSRVIGFAPLMFMKRFRMADVRTNYPPHILAFNTWAGDGAPQPPAGVAGLRHFTIVVPGATALGDLAAALEQEARAGRREDWRGLVASIAAEWPRVHAALASEPAGLPDLQGVRGRISCEDVTFHFVEQSFFGRAG
mgnify:CR=1 FL=1